MQIDYLLHSKVPKMILLNQMIEVYMTKLEQYLENECNFRDYEVLPLTKYMKVNKVGIHVRIENMENIVNDAINQMLRYGFPMIYFYTNQKTVLTLIK